MREFLTRLKEDVMILDKQGNIKHCSEKLSYKLGYDEKEISTLKVEELVEDKKCIKEILMQETIREERHITFKDRHAYEYIYQVKVIKDLLEGEETFFLIGKEQSAMKSRKRFIEDLLEQIPLGIVVKDLMGKTIYANKMSIQNEGIKEENISIQKVPFYGEDEKVVGMLEVSQNCTLSKVLGEKAVENYEELIKIGEEGERGSEILNENIGDRRLQECMLQEFQADGITILSYSEEKQSLISKTQMGICKEVTCKSGVVWSEMNFIKEWSRCTEFKGIKKVEESIFKGQKELLWEHGIKYIAAYPIYYIDEFQGLLILSFKEYKRTYDRVETVVERACKQIGSLIKHKKLSKELKQRLGHRQLVEEELNHFLDTAADIIKIVDTKGYIREVSQTFCELLGKRKEELIGKVSKQFIEEENKAKCKKRDAFETIRSYKNLKEEKCWIEWRVKYIEEKQVYICIGTDCTKEIEAKEEERNNIKHEFFVKLSHEFKTPLNIILATLHLVEGTNNSLSKDNKLHVIKQSTYKFLKMFYDLMDITEIDSGNYKMHLESHNIVEVVEDVTQAVAKYLKEEESRIIFDTDIEECRVFCAPEKIESIMLNLLAGAYKYAFEKGKITVEVKGHKDKVQVTIKNEGRGMSDEEVEGLFDRYKSGKKDEIGLVIAKALVEMHGGTIEAESKLNQGTKVSFWLPIILEGEERACKDKRKRVEISKEKCQIVFSGID